MVREINTSDNFRTILKALQGIGGVGLGANLGMIAIADIALKFVPAFGSLVSAGAGAIATKGLGDAAIAYFLTLPEAKNAG